MKSYKNLLLENKAWAKSKTLVDKEYFSNMARTQTPEFLWIGCSDSRVPANEITNTEPGEIFVHRNIANLVVHTDMNMLSVLQYAVEFLKVKHIIVCGHYGCGGINSSMTKQNFGILNKWLRNIKDVYELHFSELEAITDQNLKSRRMVEFNVKEQVLNLAKTSIVQRAWQNEQRPVLHGWVYDMEDGLLKELVMMDHTTELHPIFMYDKL